MQKRSLLNRLAKRYPGYKVRSDYVVRVCGRVLSGCALDISPSTVNIWKFIIPLYDPFPFLHLGLSRRLGSIERYATGFLPEDAGRILKEISDLLDKSSAMNMQNFEVKDVLLFLKENQINSLYSRKIEGFSLALMGDRLGAIHNLREVVEVLEKNPGQVALRGADEILESLEAGDSSYQEIMAFWEAHNAANFA